MCTSYCRCAAPDTPIATPTGRVPIRLLRVGDLVNSLHAGRMRAVPIVRTSRLPVHNHWVVRATLDNGEVLELSPGHPTADGRTFGELDAGDMLGAIELTRVETVPYGHAFTYDILPDSDSGSYLAAGVWIGSTLAPQ